MNILRLDSGELQSLASWLNKVKPDNVEEDLLKRYIQGMANFSVRFDSALLQRFESDRYAKARKIIPSDESPTVCQQPRDTTSLTISSQSDQAPTEKEQPSITSPIPPSA